MMLFNENIDTLKKRISEITEYIEYINYQKKILNFIGSNRIVGKDLESGFLENYEHNLMKVVNSNIQYSAIIISLYGLFEDFIDDVFRTYLNELYSSLDYEYDKLPNKIKMKHQEKTGEFLTNSNRFKNYDTDINSVINNFHACINESSNSQLNEELLLSHSANMGVEQLISFMNEFNIDKAQNKIINSKDFINYTLLKLEKENFDDTKKYINKKTDKKELFSELNLLLSERNNVAHSWIVDERISLSIIKDEIVPFIECLSDSICNVLLENYFGILIKNNKLKKFGKAIKVINNRILCINSKEAKLKKGEYIYAKIKNNVKVLKILNLQINKDSHEVIEEKNINIGIEVDESIKKTYEFYYK